MSESLIRVPLFPLGLVLMPRMPLPLHIFEQRYRAMISRCLSTEEPFGVVLHTGSTIQSVGCLAGIDSVINRYDDGRLDILTIGTERFHIRSIYEDESYLQADVDLFHDEDVTADSSEELRRLADSARRDLIDFAETAGYTVEHELLESLEPEELSFMLATTDIFSVEEKQELIELRSTSERMVRASAALDRGRQHRTMTNKIREVLGKDDDEDISHLFN